MSVVQAKTIIPAKNDDGLEEFRIPDNFNCDIDDDPDIDAYISLLEDNDDVHRQTDPYLQDRARGAA